MASSSISRKDLSSRVSGTADKWDCTDTSETDGGIIIADCIYDVIHLPPICKAIVDTPQFQRLREIKQCGACSYVYPSAVHTRFEHSLGVFHMAGEMIDSLKNAEVVITTTETLCVKIAGLCHDLGHGPYSHSWEMFIKRVGGVPFHHEEMSVNIFKKLIELNPIVGIQLNECGIGPDEVSFICDIIIGHPSEGSRYNKPFLYQIIANKKTGVDVDKWDYLLRDGFHFHIPLELPYKRILSVIDIFEGNIAFGEKVASSIIEMFASRFKMHKTCYQHRVAVTIEQMYLDSFKAANNYYFINGEKNGKPYRYKLSECHENVDVFLKLNDHIISNLLISEDSNLKEAQNILGRIRKRNLYQTVAQVKLNEKGFDCLQFEEKMAQIFAKQNLKFRAKILSLDYGSNKDPLENVYFIERKQKPPTRKYIKTDEITFYQRSTELCLKELLVLVTCDKNENSWMSFREEIEDKINHLTNTEF